jgi:hypothetical protein
MPGPPTRVNSDRRRDKEIAQARPLGSGPAFVGRKYRMCNGMNFGVSGVQVGNSGARELSGHHQKDGDALKGFSALSTPLRSRPRNDHGAERGASLTRMDCLLASQQFKSLPFAAWRRCTRQCNSVTFSVRLLGNRASGSSEPHRPPARSPPAVKRCRSAAPCC